MKESRRIGRIIAIIVSVCLLGGIGWVALLYVNMKSKPVDIGNFQPTIEMFMYYEKTYSTEKVVTADTIMPVYKNKIENLKWIAYYEGSSDYFNSRKKSGPRYSSEAFEGLEKEDLNKNKRLYKKMYNTGYRDAKKGLDL